MNVKDFAAELEVSPRRVRRWIALGMPHERKGRAFVLDFEIATDWLLAQGKIEEARPVPSRAAVAEYFGVSERTIGNWRAQGCPGEPGNYDLTAIERWRVEQNARAPQDGDLTAKNKEADLQIKRVKLAALRQDLIPLDPVLRAIRRVVGAYKARLADLPDELIARLPLDFTPDQKAEIRAGLVERIDDAYNVLAELAEEITEEEDVEEEA